MQDKLIEAGSVRWNFAELDSLRNFVEKIACADESWHLSENTATGGMAPSASERRIYGGIEAHRRRRCAHDPPGRDERSRSRRSA